MTAVVSPAWTDNFGPREGFSTGSGPKLSAQADSWLGYTVGRAMPDDLSAWVLRDLTGKHTYTRHLVRGMVPFLPLFTAFLLFPGPFWIRAAMTLLALILALFYCAAYMAPNRTHRLTQHGYPADLDAPGVLHATAHERARYNVNHPRPEG
ncbi:DUF5313 family protein [Nocardia arthritidis]|uniref:DUF5313 domain-containing protein n=1 Tax=Nocardia arthritidis TaxID=228602 RepID=A0A6G9YL97_9NOCA|nr:DUF5313 family protein [Nocardia arthritidis]QIS13847.1 hypothetical protein F5544_30010 [Nocardia arthritidis]